MKLADAIMSEKKKKTLFPIAIALIALVSVLAIIIFLANSPVTQRLPASTPAITPVLSNVELNASEGFNSSQLVAGPNISPLLVLPPGGNGTIPFTVYSSAQVPFNVSLSIYLGQNVTTNGVQYSFSPANFTVNPGQQAASVLTITADKDAPSAFYTPNVEIQTNEQESPYYIEGEGVDIPALLIGNSTPSCIYIVTEYDVSPTPPPVSLPSSVPAPTNASVTQPITTPPYAPQVPEPFPAPTVHLTSGESTTVIFACATQDPLSLNATVPTGFSAEFSPSPLDIIFSYTSGNLYALTVTPSPNLSPGNYKVNAEATLGPFPFECSFQIEIN